MNLNENLAKSFSYNKVGIDYFDLFVVTKFGDIWPSDVSGYEYKVLCIWLEKLLQKWKLIYGNSCSLKLIK